MDAHYPVKRKGERRRLDPNWTGIAWLEAETLHATEIVETLVFEGALEPAGLCSLRTKGHQKAINNGMYPRRMFDIFTLDQSAYGSFVQPCPDCDNFAVSWNCPEHPRGGKADEGFKMPAALMEAFQEQTDRMLSLADVTVELLPRHLRQGFADSVRDLAEGSITIDCTFTRSLTGEWTIDET